MSLVERVVGQFSVLVVYFFQVLNNGSRFPECQVRVWVHDCLLGSTGRKTSMRCILIKTHQIDRHTWHTPIRIDIYKRRLLDIVEFEGVDSIRYPELFKDDSYLYMNLSQSKPRSNRNSTSMWKSVPFMDLGQKLLEWLVFG